MHVLEQRHNIFCPQCSSVGIKKGCLSNTTLKDLDYFVKNSVKTRQASGGQTWRKCQDSNDRMYVRCDGGDVLVMTSISCSKLRASRARSGGSVHRWRIIPPCVPKKSFIILQFLKFLMSWSLLGISTFYRSIDPPLDISKASLKYLTQE